MKIKYSFLLATVLSKSKSSVFATDAKEANTKLQGQVLRTVVKADDTPDSDTDTDTTVPRVTLSFKRISDWEGESSSDMAEGEVITSLDEINDHLNEVGVNIKPFHLARVADDDIRAKIIAGTVTHDEILSQVGISSIDEMMDSIHDGKREPM